MNVRTTMAASVLLFVCAAVSGAQQLASAEAAARTGRMDAALTALHGVTGSAAAEALRCSLYSSIDKQEDAIHACEAAATLAPASSNNALALARAYGEKAQHSGALTGMRMVGKIRSNFERAVQLDGTNIEALSDLGEFYVEAPAMVGGGLDKAQPLVGRLQSLSPARAHRLLAMIAEKRKDDAGAEQEYRKELAAAATAEAYMDLAKFYRGRKQWDAAVENAKLALSHDSKHGPDTLDAAQFLIEGKRDAAAAQAGLQQYLRSPQEHVAAYAKAHVLLGQSLRAAGDHTQADHEFQTALDLAHDYDAARQGLSR